MDGRETQQADCSGEEAGCWLLALEGRGLSRPEEGGNAVKGIAGVGQGP